MFGRQSRVIAKLSVVCWLGGERAGRTWLDSCCDDVERGDARYAAFEFQSWGAPTDAESGEIDNGFIGAQPGRHGVIIA